MRNKIGNLQQLEKVQWKVKGSDQSERTVTVVEQSINAKE